LSIRSASLPWISGRAGTSLASSRGASRRDAPAYTKDVSQPSSSTRVCKGRSADRRPLPSVADLTPAEHAAFKFICEPLVRPISSFQTQRMQASKMRADRLVPPLTNSSSAATAVQRCLRPRRPTSTFGSSLLSLEKQPRTSPPQTRASARAMAQATVGSGARSELEASRRTSCAAGRMPCDTFLYVL
jgi:hypothetical protein